MNEEEKEWIAHALMEDERRRCISKVLKLDCKDAVAKGNNYISDIFRLNLKVVLNSGECEERSVIYKIIPRSDDVKMPNVKESGLFTKEGRAYMEILPELEKLLQKVSPHAEGPWPKLYGVKQNFEGLLMEDISVKGYKMTDRLEGFDYDHCCLALEKLAEFHALSAVLIKRGDISVDEFDVYHFHKNKEEMRKNVDDLISSLVRVLEENWKEEWLQYVDGLKELKNTFVERLYENHRRDDSKFNTLNHGDFWSNNILVKYDADGLPQNMKIVDYQLLFYNSPCFDLQYFFSVSLRLDLFERKHELLNLYYSKLKKNLELYDYCGKSPSFEEFMESYEKTRWFGWFCTILLRPFMGCKNVEDLVKEHKGDVDMKTVGFEELGYLMKAYGSENVTISLKSCIKDMKEKGVI